MQKFRRSLDFLLYTVKIVINLKCTPRALQCLDSKGQILFNHGKKGQRAGPFASPRTIWSQ